MALIVPQDTRLFTNHSGNQLSSEMEWVCKGTSLDILEKRVMHYDHKDQLAIKVPTGIGERWILVKEANIPLDS